MKSHGYLSSISYISIGIFSSNVEQSYSVHVGLGWGLRGSGAGGTKHWQRASGAYILKAKKSGDSTFQSQKICGKKCIIRDDNNLRQECVIQSKV